jgi:hypothetical protein
MKLHLRTVVLIVCMPMLVMLGGCPAAAIIAQALPKIVPAQYAGLKGKSTAIVVWAERDITIDFPTIQADITAGLTKKLQEAQVAEEPDDLKDTTFPVTWQSIRRYQMDNPDADTAPVAEIASVVGVQRLIYLEVSEFQTRSDVSLDLYRGHLVASMKVIEWENGKAKTAYDEGNIIAKFPKKGPDEGAPNIGDQRTYLFTIEEFTRMLAWKFYKHEEEHQPGD